MGISRTGSLRPTPPMDASAPSDVRTATFAMG